MSDETAVFRGAEYGPEHQFVEHMKARREALGWSQTEMAKQLTAAARADGDDGTTFYQATIQRIEAGERPLKLFEALLVSEVFGVAFDDLLNGVSVTIAYNELADELQAEVVEPLVKDAQSLERWSVVYEPVLRERLAQYLEAVSETAGAEVATDIVETAEAAIALFAELPPLGESVLRSVNEVARKFRALPRDYPAQHRTI